LRSKKSEKKRKTKKGGFAELPDDDVGYDERVLRGSKSVPRDLRHEDG